MTDLTIIVLTKDEEANLPVLLASAGGVGAAFVIVDSGSTDDTVAIAEAAGCKVLNHAFENHAAQLNWSIDHADITTPWVMRMDADERFTPELVDELRDTLPKLGGEVTGLLLKRQVWFWGRWIRHGGYYPTWLLRVWRNGRARCEQRWMDEHMILDGGEIHRLRHDIIDENHKGPRLLDRQAQSVRRPRGARHPRRRAGAGRRVAGRRRSRLNSLAEGKPLSALATFPARPDLLSVRLFRTFGHPRRPSGLGVPLPTGFLESFPRRRQAARGEVARHAPNERLTPIAVPPPPFSVARSVRGV